VHERDIEPHIPVFDKSTRADGTFSRDDFAYDTETDAYSCPAGKLLKRRQRRHDDRSDQMPADGILRYRATKADCDAWPRRSRREAHPAPPQSSGYSEAAFPESSALTP